MKAPYGKYATFKARVAKMQPGDELQWPDMPTVCVSSYLANWGAAFGFRLSQFKGPDGQRWIRRVAEAAAAPAPKATVENGGVPGPEAAMRRLLRAGHSPEDARRIVAEAAQVSQAPAPAPVPVVSTPTPPAPPEPATAKPCGCDADGYCYACTTPEQRAKLDAALIGDGSASLEKLKELADRGEAIAASIGPSATDTPAPGAPETAPAPTPKPEALEWVIRQLFEMRDYELARARLEIQKIEDRYAHQIAGLAKYLVFPETLREEAPR